MCRSNDFRQQEGVSANMGECLLKEERGTAPLLGHNNALLLRINDGTPGKKYIRSNNNNVIIHMNIRLPRY